LVLNKVLATSQIKVKKKSVNTLSKEPDSSKNNPGGSETF
jgi:hypothetical protein